MAEKIISFGVTLEQYENIASEAEKSNMSISMFCKSKVINTLFDEYYLLLLEKIADLPANKNLKFTISDLFENEQWLMIPKGIRLAIGKQFNIMVNNKTIKNIKEEGFGTSKTMHYSKLD
jgi:hypothetical protein